VAKHELRYVDFLFVVDSDGKTFAIIPDCNFSFLLVDRDPNLRHLGVSMVVVCRVHQNFVCM
jgi:hypothetical protein